MTKRVLEVMSRFGLCFSDFFIFFIFQLQKLFVTGIYNLLFVCIFFSFHYLFSEFICFRKKKHKSLKKTKNIQIKAVNFNQLKIFESAH